MDGAPGRPKLLTLSWDPSGGAASYEYCIDTNVNSGCDGSWSSTGTSRSVTLVLTGKRTYEWQVRALNSDGTTYANSGTSWTFKTK